MIVLLLSVRPRMRPWAQLACRSHVGSLVVALVALVRPTAVYVLYAHAERVG